MHVRVQDSSRVACSSDGLCPAKVYWLNLDAAAFYCNLLCSTVLLVVLVRAQMSMRGPTGKIDSIGFQMVLLNRNRCLSTLYENKPHLRQFLTRHLPCESANLLGERGRVNFSTHHRSLDMFYFSI